MNDDEMSHQIRDAARETYNVPPEPPREEMWARIRSARQAERAGRRNGARPDSPDVIPAAPGTEDPDVVPLRRRISPWLWRALPFAALVLLSFGLGRLSLLYQHAPSVATTARPATSSPATYSPASTSTTPEPAASRAQPATLAAAASPGRSDGEAVSGTRDARRSVPSNGEVSPRAGSSIYRFAAAQTLGQAELLLTSFRAESRSRGGVDPQVAEWAGDILSSTRLLIDSPAGRDPKLRPLLEDLELVLAQIVQLRGAPASARPGDADLIDHALQQRDLLPRLRTAVPAGAPIGT